MRTARLAAVRAIAGGVVWGAGVGTLAIERSWRESGLGDGVGDGSVSFDGAAAVVVVLVVMAAVGVAVPVLQRALPRPGSVPAVIGVVLFAMYCCVPETGQIPQVAVAVVVSVALELAVDRVLPWPLLVAVVGLVLWSGLFGASGRESALVGAVFSLWPLLLPAAVVGSSRRTGAAATFAVVAVASIAAVTVARTGALQPTVSPAFVAVAIAAPVSLVVAFAVGRWGGRTSARTGDVPQDQK